MKKALSILLAMLLICSTGTIAFAAEDNEIFAEGTCGTTVNWKLDDSGQLTIYGSGSMQNYWHTEDQRPSYEEHKEQVTSLVIEEGVTAIGKYAFYNFNNLTGKLVFPNSLKSIWKCAFEGCEGLTEAPQFNDTLNDIGFAAFRACKNMKGDLVIPDSVTNLGIQAFSSCSSLDGTLYIGKNVQRLWGGVFYNCTGLQGDIVIPDSVTSVDGSAFYSCKGFHGTLHIGNSVTKIEPMAFAYCKNLTGNLIIPDSVTEIGSAAFYSCDGFNGILKLSNNLERIYEEIYEPGAFQGCSGLTGDLELPETLTCIGKKSFYDCCNLSGTLKIPESVETIGKDAFHGCAANTDLIQFFSEHPEFLNIEERITEPTCRINGIKYYTAKCADCASVLKTWNERLEPAHKLTEVPYAAATEDTDGTRLHYACSVCGDLFLDAAGTEATISADVILHYADAPKKENAKLENGGTPASFDLATYCKHDGSELSREKITLTVHPAVAATPEEDGNVKYYTDEAGNRYIYDEETVSFLETDDVLTAYSVVKETEVKLNTYGLSFTMGSHYQIIATVLPENATFKDVTFTVDDPTIVQTDQDGNLTPLSVGITYVHVTSHHGISIPVYIQVRHGHIAGDPQYEDVTVEPTCVKTGIGMWVVRCAECGEMMQRRGPEVIPATGIHLTELVQVREPSEEADGYTQHYICTTCDGLFLDEEAKQPTTAEEIVLHFADAPKIENSRLETEEQPASFELVTYCLHDHTELGRKTVTLEMHPAKDVTPTEDGNVKYYTDEDGNKYVYDEDTGAFVPLEDVSTQFPVVPVTDIELNEDHIELREGETFQLIATAQPEDATFKEISFTSSDEPILSVNEEGLITAIKPGSATIVCRTQDGVSVTVTVTVEHKHVAGEPLIENITKEPTCKENGLGDLVARCTVCGEEIDRETNVTIPATGNHTPGEGQKTQEIKGTCETEGSYVFVVKCEVCGEVLSSEKIFTGYGDHAWNDGDVQSGKYDKYTVTDYTCQNCGQHKTEKTRNPNYQFRCKRCDWYDARRDTKGVLGLIYKLIHDITHMVQHINFLT